MDIRAIGEPCHDYSEERKECCQCYVVNRPRTEDDSGGDHYAVAVYHLERASPVIGLNVLERVPDMISVSGYKYDRFIVVREEESSDGE